MLVLLFAVLVAAASGAPSIQTPQGSIIGRQVRSNVIRYSGIPFARPPLGNLRFARAVLNTDSFDTLNATEFGAPCIQNPLGDPRPPNHLNAPPPNENCLFLNLWVPSSAQNSSARMPVLVYIFGGGLCSGYTGAYDGANIAAKHDIIVASISYRLGALGFLVDESAFGDGGSGGMNGLHDVIVGLTWLRDNIGHFGGDSASVTIFGQSSGSYLICTLCVSPLARGLFHRAILQSGPCIGGPPGKGWGPGNLTAGAAATRGVMARLNASTIAELRAADASAVQWPDALMNDPKVAPYFSGYFVDRFVVPQPIDELWRSGRINPTALILGYTTKDGTAAFYGTAPTLGLVPGDKTQTSAADYQAALASTWGGLADAVAAAYPLPNYGGSPQAAFVQADADVYVICPQRVLAAHAVASGLPTWSYEFAHFGCTRPASFPPCAPLSAPVLAAAPIQFP